MDGDNKTLVAIVALFVFMVLGITVGVSDYWKDHNAKVVELVKAGADPIAVMCALQDDRNQQPKCMVLAAKK